MIYRRSQVALATRSPRPTADQLLIAKINVRRNHCNNQLACAQAIVEAPACTNVAAGNQAAQLAG